MLATATHQRDLVDGNGRVKLPRALVRKYPNSKRECCWQFAIPQERRWRNSNTGKVGRHHIDESSFQWTLKVAVRKAGQTKRAASHTSRHSFATHLVAGGYGIRTIQELLGPKYVRTTKVYSHVLNQGGRGGRRTGPWAGWALGANSVSRKKQHHDKATDGYIANYNN